MQIQMNVGGYDLYEITEHEWIIHTKGGTLYTGTFKEVVKHAVQVMGFELEEFNWAIKEMANKGTNGAHFGMHKSFIFAFQKDFNSNQKTG